MANFGDTLSGIMGGIGGTAGKKEMEEAKKLGAEARQTLQNVYVPTIEEQRVIMQNPELAGLLEAEQLQDSALAGVSTDPRLKQAQMKALEEMAGLSQQGLGAEDKFAFNQLRNQAGATAQAQQASVLQNAAANGTADSGTSIMAQLNAGQQQANRLQQGGMQQAAEAAAARRAALGQYASQSSNMANQDFAQKSQQASAKDAISKFNTQNRQGVNQTNLTNRQNIANMTAQNANTGAMYNSGLHQNQFANNFAKAGGVAGQTNNMAAQAAAQGAAKAQGQAALVSGVLGAAGQVGGMMIGAPTTPAQTAKSGYGGGASANAMDDFYMNKLDK